MNYPHLFTPIEIQNMKLRNRVVFPAMLTRLAQNGIVTDELVAYHAARAKGGSGLNILEATSVHLPSAPCQFPRLTSDDYIPGHQNLTTGIRAAGGKSCVQLWQGGFAPMSADPACIAVVPSDLDMRGHVIPAASIELIESCVQAFGEAARRAVEAGYDCVEFHCGHNYSPHSFLSAAFNKREDAYGGTFEKRMRYPLECIRAIRANVPRDFPVIMRIVAQDDCVENGMTIDDMIAFAKIAEAEGINALNVSRGNKMSAAFKYEVPSLDIKPGFNADNAAKIKAGTGMITMIAGRINSPELAESIIAEDKADMVVIGRGQICDPEFCNKASAGHAEQIIKCVGCNQGCYDRVITGTIYPHLSCLRNPSVGEELTFSYEPAEETKTVLVIGGGMAGMEAAYTLQQRGHYPILVEADDHLGGQFYLAGFAPRKQEMSDAAISRGEQLKHAGVEIRLNTKADEILLEDLKPDAVIISMGATPASLNVPGVNGANVYDSIQILKGEVVPVGDTVVIGGGLVGLEVAETIAEKGGNVTVVEMQDAIAKDVGAGRKMSLMEGIMAAGIQSVVHAKCTEIRSNGVMIELDGRSQTIPCDNVVISVGSSPTDHQWVQDYCKKNSIPFYIAGDSVTARRAIDAVHEGVAVARVI